MVLTRKKRVLLIFVGIVILGAAYIPVCSPLCPSSHHDNPGSQSECTFASHSYVQINVELPVVSPLPFLGLFLLISIGIIPTGFSLSPFRPPNSTPRYPPLFTTDLKTHLDFIIQNATLALTPSAFIQERKAGDLARGRSF